MLPRVPNLRAAAPRKEAPHHSFLSIEQIAYCLRGAELLEEAHRGPTWEKVAYIRWVAEVERRAGQSCASPT